MLLGILIAFNSFGVTALAAPVYDGSTKIETEYAEPEQQNTLRRAMVPAEDVARNKKL